MERRLVSKNSP